MRDFSHIKSAGWRRARLIICLRARLLICLFAAFALLILPACGVFSRGPDATTQPDASGGEYEDNGGGDGSGEEGGDGDNEDASGGGATSSGGAEETDDAYATTAPADYSPEVKAQVDAFCETASQLPLDDIPSAAELLSAFRGLAFKEPVNDELFFAYEEYMQTLCEGLNSLYEEEPPDDAEINGAVENGFLYVADGHPPYFILRPDFLKYTFSDAVSEKVRAFLNLHAKHYEFHSGYDLIHNEKLMVSLDQLAEMIVDWENYIRVYPDASNRMDIENYSYFYLKIYIGSIQIENSGLYLLAGTDENGETLYKLMDEPRQSYLKFVENYPDSTASPIIAELYKIYNDNNFLYSAEIEDFFRKYGLAYIDLEPVE